MSNTLPGCSIYYEAALIALSSCPYQSVSVHNLPNVVGVLVFPKSKEEQVFPKSPGPKALGLEKGFLEPLRPKTSVEQKLPVKNAVVI